MKVFYQLVTCFSAIVLLFLSTATFGYPPDEGMALELAKWPDLWRIEFVRTASDRFVDLTEEEAKTKLIHYLDKNGITTYRHLEHLAAGIVVVFSFGLLGWLRERRIEKTSSIAREAGSRFPKE